MQSKLTTVAYPVYNTIQNDGILFHTHIALLVTKSRLFMPVLVVLTRTHLCEYPLSLEKPSDYFNVKLVPRSSPATLRNS